MGIFPSQRAWIPIPVCITDRLIAQIEEKNNKPEIVRLYAHSSGKSWQTIEINVNNFTL